MFRLMTYNIRHGGRGREAAIAAVINACAPDLVLLQEATDPRSVERIAQGAGMRYAVPDSGEWLTVRTVVDDPLYLVQPFMVSTNFRKEADGASKWSPKACRE